GVVVRYVVSVLSSLAILPAADVIVVASLETYAASFCAALACAPIVAADARAAWSAARAFAAIRSSRATFARAAEREAASVRLRAVASARALWAAAFCCVWWRHPIVNTAALTSAPQTKASVVSTQAGHARARRWRRGMRTAVVPSSEPDQGSVDCQLI